MGVAEDKVWKHHAECIGETLVYMDIRHWFGFAWNREVPVPMTPAATGPQLNLGAGYRQVPWAYSIDKEHGYDLDSLSTWDRIAEEFPEVTGIWAHGVFEHLSDPAFVLAECAARLTPGGILNIVVPHGASYLYLEDLDHKHPFTEETWRNLLDNPYYNASAKLPLRLHTCFIMGVVWRNLALFTQFIKEI